MTKSNLGFPVRVGILGGGQLARMLATASYQLGIMPFIYATKSTDCATQVVNHVIFADGSDERLKSFVRQVEVLVIENEFIDLDQLERCLGGVPLIPGIQVLRVVQSKLEQKKALARLGIPSLAFHEVNGVGDLKAACEKLGSAVVLKTARFGYDGKGTFIYSKGVNASEFFKGHPDFRGYAEPLAHFKRELAVIVARSASGQVKAFSVVESNQAGGICRWVKAPAGISGRAKKSAEAIATNVIVKMGGVGVFGVELFHLDSGKIVVNEIAPRVHNTGHFTMNGSIVSQFEQHMRCAVDLPLGGTEPLYGGSAMVNILGGPKAENIGENNVTGLDLRRLEKILTKSGEAFWIHWYGKTGPGVGRKLGHINAGAKTAGRALKIALKVRAALKL